MPTIHFVERLNNLKKLPDQSGDWESGYWVVAEQTAAKLVGGDIYLHPGQQEPSRFGGTIVSYRVHKSEDDLNGRVVFRFTPTMGHKGVKAGADGWGNEKKIVW